MVKFPMDTRVSAVVLNIWLVSVDCTMWNLEYLVQCCACLPIIFKTSAFLGEHLVKASFIALSQFP